MLKKEFTLAHGFYLDFRQRRSAQDMKTIDEKNARKQARFALRQIYEAAISAAQPNSLLAKSITFSGDAVAVDTLCDRCRAPAPGKVYVLGVGKGVDITGRYWEEIFGDRLESGILVTRNRLSHERLKRISVLAAGHPIPDRRSESATRQCLDLLRGAGSADLVVFLLMGGASSLMVEPAPGLTLADKRVVTRCLLKSGMVIAGINCVRKHLSSVKGGGILRAAYPARVLTLAISDVIGDDPSVIGSAPTRQDPTTFRDAWKLLSRHKLLDQIPARVKNHLLRGVRGLIPETMKPGNQLTAHSPFILLANNRDALTAANARAERLGFHTTIITSELSGDTRVRAEELAAFLKTVPLQGKKYRRPHCFLLGGETTVKVRGKGKGGRNLEFALASALGLTDHVGVYLLSAGSDGSDGPTPAAGAFADGTTIPRARAMGLRPTAALRNNDSYAFFESLGDLFSPGPTGTNVLDLKVVLLY